MQFSMCGTPRTVSFLEAESRVVTPQGPGGVINRGQAPQCGEMGGPGDGCGGFAAMGRLSSAGSNASHELKCGCSRPVVCLLASFSEKPREIKVGLHKPEDLISNPQSPF